MSRQIKQEDSIYVKLEPVDEHMKDSGQNEQSYLNDEIAQIDQNDQSDASSYVTAPSGPNQDNQDNQKQEALLPNADELSKLVDLISQTSPELLEQAMQCGATAIKTLKAPLKTSVESTGDGETQAAQWLQSIEDLEARVKPTRTVVGVVGNTGAGKSSVINALLDEERLIPTSCLRACTAAPTEISYNYSDDPEQLYRAEVEFISPADWEKELANIFVDLLDGNGEVSRECTNQDSDCGVAYAMVRAVYPNKTKDMIAMAAKNIPALIRESAVADVLGKIRSIRARTAQELYNGIQRYVDSKEKSDRGVMEYWPLIKVVRIYTKAHAVSTGAVIVDLPGVQDSNAARGQVASKYMKECTGLWIVAPITRAVDDKTAKTLLGDQFKRQLKYDGTYSAVSFICSKTDDISITEAGEGLRLDLQIHKSWMEIEAKKELSQKLKDKLADLEDHKDVLDDLRDEIEAQWDQWEELSQKLAAGLTVYAPLDKTKKRKRVSRLLFSSRKNHAADDVDGLISDLDNDDFSNSEKETRQPLTETAIDDMLKQLKDRKSSVRDNKKETFQKIGELRDQIFQLDRARRNLLTDITSLCIRGRNEYSRAAIKRDFAMGVKELDQENAAEEDDANFNPEEDMRDYEEVARGLEVFCVSSRAYQKLCNRLKKDNFSSDGFAAVEDTEIPQLQRHARKLTEAVRAASSRRFLNDLLQLLNSMKMWATSQTFGSNLNESQKRAKEDRLKESLGKLKNDFDAAVQNCCETLSTAFQDSIFAAFDRNIPKAENLALATAQGWGAHRNQGGLVWATYKATTRREGIYSGAAGSRDFNAELFQPIAKSLATPWEKAFQRRLPETLKTFADTMKTLVESFHAAAVAIGQEQDGDLARIGMLNSQLSSHVQRISEMPPAVLGITQDIQRDANREFTPAIQEEMKPAYESCVQERGTGSFMRMKRTMANHVDEHRQQMFRNATDKVQAILEEMCSRVASELVSHVQELHGKLSQDYSIVLLGTDNAYSTKIPFSEKLLRKQMQQLLEGSNSWFDGLLSVERSGADTANTDQAMKDATAAADEASENKDHGSKNTEAELGGHRSKREPEV